MNLTDDALRYAACGWRVFPLRPGGKLPKIPAVHPDDDPARSTCKGTCGQDGHGCHDATTNPDRIRGWWRRWPQANVGIATGPGSGLLVVDVDPHHDGVASLAQLETADDSGPLLTSEAETRSGGTHLYFAYPSDTKLEFGNTTGRLGPGIDTRATGGYVVAPPSVITGPGGGTYRWCTGVGEVRPLPGWLLDRLVAIEAARTETTSPAAATPGSRSGSVAPGVPQFGRAEPSSFATRMNGLLSRLEDECGKQGNRNQLLYWAGCRVAEMLAEGAPAGYANLLVEAGQAMGLSAGESIRTLRSAGARP